MKRFFITILLLCCLKIVYGQLSEQLNRHFIIAIDGAVPLYADKLIDSGTPKLIERVLKDYNWNQNDYVTIISYQIDCLNPNFDAFAWSPKSADGNLISWVTLHDGNLRVLGNWEDIAFTQHKRKYNISGTNASFQSIAKEYIIRNSRPTNSKAANETIILMLTDEKVNGIDNNWVNEWTNLEKTFSAISPYKDKVRKEVEEILHNYNFTPIDVFGVRKKIIDGRFANPYALIAYKAVIRAPLPLQSISFLPAQLPVKRVKGGYRFDLDLSSQKDEYQIEKLELSIMKNGKQYVSDNDLIESFIDKSDLTEGDTIQLKAWVRFNDGIYNGTVMNPYDPDYQDMLTVKQALVFKNDAKIFGTFPLYDAIWWFFPNDIQSAVITWDIIFIVLFILLICLIAYKLFNRITKYVPSNNKIKINKIDGRNNH